MNVDYIETGVTAPNDGAMRTGLFRYILDRWLVPPKAFVDLGAGPCVFAKIARDRGYNVTAVDARTERLPEDIEGIEFVQSDVRHFPVDAFDVVVCLGLFYHFDLEEQQALLPRFKGKALILDTQVHVPELIAAGGDWQHRIVSRDDHTGVVFPEGDNPMASVGNEESFWHTPESMLRMFENAGRREVFVLDPLFQSKYGGRRMYFSPA